MNWINKSTIPEERFKDYQGFLYEVEFTDGTYYFGKKDFGTNDKWKEYEGSAKSRGRREVLQKTILRVVRTKRELTFREAEMLFVKGVLFDNNCIFSAASSKFAVNVADG